MGDSKSLLHWILILAMLWSALGAFLPLQSAAAQAQAPLSASQANAAQKFNGVSQYVTFGSATGLNAQQSTVETWFSWSGGGETTDAGAAGQRSIIPLVTNGRGESGLPPYNLNSYLGITGGKLGAEFKAFAGRQDCPATGKSTITPNVWRHAAATCDGPCWQLDLDGHPETDGDNCSGVLPEDASFQHPALGTFVGSGGAPKGAFDGSLEEVRIWDYAHSQAQIAAAPNAQNIAPAPGVAARWSLGKASGTAVSGSAGTAVAESLYPSGKASGWNWTQGSPFNLNTAPYQPALISPEDGSLTPPSPELIVGLDDPDGDPLEACFYGREASPDQDFTLAVLPDSQNYIASIGGGTPEIFYAQMEWIVANRKAENIAFVTHLGDVVNKGSSALQWQSADAAFDILEASPEPIPYGIAVGNHDPDLLNAPDGTIFYNTYFGYDRFAGRSYYQGAFDPDRTPPPPNNDNHVEFFTQGGLDLMVIHIKNNPSPPPEVLDWADALLASSPNRLGIVVFHSLFDSISDCTSPMGLAGKAIYDALSDRPNLLMMLGGHIYGENFCSLWRKRMNPVAILLSDYQDRQNGGSGWMRLLKFSPAAGKIFVKTFSPTLMQYETDANSQFEISFPSAEPEPFALVGSCQKTASGETARVTFPTDEFMVEHEWYVAVSDGLQTTTSPVYRFTPSPAAVLDFRLEAAKTEVQIRFKTENELEVLGFNVLRADMPDGPRFQVNPDLIAAKSPGSALGNPYDIRDQTVQQGKAYHYWIEVVSSGGSALVGPKPAAVFYDQNTWLPSIFR